MAAQEFQYISTRAKMNFHFRSLLYLSCEPTAMPPSAPLMPSGSGPLFVEWMWEMGQFFKGFRCQCLTSALISFLSFPSKFFDRRGFTTGVALGFESLTPNV